MNSWYHIISLVFVIVYLFIGIFYIDSFCIAAQPAACAQPPIGPTAQPSLQGDLSQPPAGLPEGGNA